MANRIVVDFNALDRIARHLTAVGNDIEAAASLLGGADLTKAGGAYLRLNGANISFQSISGSVSASNAAQAAVNYRSAAKRLSDHSRSLSSAVKQVSASFRTTEAGNNRGLNAGEKAPKNGGGDTISRRGDAYDRTTRTFDDDKSNGTYGADQGDMAHNKKGIWFFGFRWFEDEDLFRFIRQYDRYKNYSQTEIAGLLDQINQEGCGYIASVNNIFVEFEGQEAEFERIFGFPMYDNEGKANYDKLIVDLYANTDDRYYLDEKQGATAIVNDVILDYLNGRESEFRERYGCDPLKPDGKTINMEARQKILDEYRGQTVVTKEMDGTTDYSLTNRLEHYLDSKGLSFETESRRSDMTAGEINQYMDAGKNVNIAVDGSTLYNENGKAIHKDVGDHWMTITGVTDDGRYIVSSWGERYYLNPAELTDPSYLITDISIG